MKAHAHSGGDKDISSSSRHTGVPAKRVRVSASLQPRARPLDDAYIRTGIATAAARELLVTWAREQEFRTSNRKRRSKVPK